MRKLLFRYKLISSFLLLALCCFPLRRTGIQGGFLASSLCGSRTALCSRRNTLPRIESAATNLFAPKAKRKVQSFFAPKAKRQVQSFFAPKAKRQVQSFFAPKAKRQVQSFFAPKAKRQV